MIFKGRAYFFKLQAVNIVNIGDSVGVAHGNGGDEYLFAVNGDGLVYKCIAAYIHRNVRRLQNSLAHIHQHGLDLAVFGIKGQLLYSASCFESDACLICKVVIIDKLAYAACGVSAHISLAAVGIEHSHSEIRLVGGHYKHKSVGTYAEVAVADDLGNSFGVSHGLLKAVHVNIIVADALHFCKFHNCKSFRYLYSYVFRISAATSVRVTR